MIDQPFGATLPRSTLPAPPKTRGLPLVGSLPALVRRPFDFLYLLKKPGPIGQVGHQTVAHVRVY